MAKSILCNINLNGNELQNVRIQNVSALPATGVEGQIVYLSTDKELYKFNGTQWQKIGTGAIEWADILNKPTTIAGYGITNAYTKSETDTFLGNKVDKVEGKGLSTNDYTTSEKNKLAGIASGAEVNVNADWNAVSGDAQILNKPTIPTKTSDLTNDSGFLTQHQSLSAYRTSSAQDVIDSAMQGDIDAIEGKIPTQATSSNQLADKAFVNSSINNVTAYYITKDAQGNAFGTKAELDSATTFYSGGQVRVPTRNDYCIVRVDETQQNGTTRYYYQNQWEFQYLVNETPLTSAQLLAINSGITATLVGNYNSHIASTSNPHNVTKAQVGLGNVDNTADLSKPISNATQTALDGKQATISDLATIRSNAEAGASKVSCTDATVGGFGYTKNAGTVTSVGITMNGASKGTVTTSGSIDLGTVLTAHQDISGKQDTLVSGTNIKTINNQSILGAGNIDIQGGGGGSTVRTYTGSLGTTWVKDTTANWYTQVVSVEGMLSTDNPDADVKLDLITTAENIESALAQWSNVFRVVPSDNSVTVYSSKATTSAITLVFNCVRGTQTVILNANVGTSWTKDATANWYTQQVSVTGALSTDNYDADVDLSTLTTAENIESALAQWSNIFKVVAGSGTVTFYSSKATTAQISVVLRSMR